MRDRGINLIPAFLSGVALIGASVMAGQTPLKGDTEGFNGSSHFPAPPAFAGRAVKGEPYSGEQTNESVQTLADGTHVTHASPGIKLYRDSAGRVRSEHVISSTAAQQNADAISVVEITDPVAHLKYVLDAVHKTAHRQQIALEPAGMLVGVSEQSLPPNVLVEKLGTDTMEGLLVEGTRSSGTGNSEIWTSPELKVQVLVKSSDPQFGEHTMKLTNVSRAEPSPDLFQVPADYSLVDEAGDFSIQWGSNQ